MKRRSQIFGKTLFVDLMMSTLVVVTALLIASNAAEKEEKKKTEEAGLRTEGKYAVVMQWPDKSPDDVDLYVRDPNGEVAYFESRDVGLMNLEYDDRGASSDKVVTSQGEVQVDKNQERVIIRGIVPGEYTVNVHMYSKNGPGPTPVTVMLVRLKGEDAEIVRKVRTLASRGDEQTAFRFTLRADESVGDINELPRTFTRMPGNGPAAPPQGGF